MGAFFVSVTALQRGPMAAGLHPFFTSLGWVLSAPTLSWGIFLVVSHENQRPLAPSFKDLELPWVREMTQNPTWPGAFLPTSVDPVSLQTVSFYDCKHR